MYGLMGKIQAQAGQRDALAGHLLHAAQLLSNLEECYLYVVSHVDDDPDAVWVTEIWHSEADHQASLTHEAVRNLIAVARPIIAGMSDRVTFTPIGGKGISENR